MQLRRSVAALLLFAAVETHGDCAFNSLTVHLITVPYSSTNIIGAAGITVAGDATRTPATTAAQCTSHGTVPDGGFCLFSKTGYTSAEANCIGSAWTSPTTMNGVACTPVTIANSALGRHHGVSEQVVTVQCSAGHSCSPCQITCDPATSTFSPVVKCEADCSVPTVQGASLEGTGCTEGSTATVGTTCLWVREEGHTCTGIGMVTCAAGVALTPPSCVENLCDPFPFTAGMIAGPTLMDSLPCHANQVLGQRTLTECTLQCDSSAGYSSSTGKLSCSTASTTAVSSLTCAKVKCVSAFDYASKGLQDPGSLDTCRDVGSALCALTCNPAGYIAHPSGTPTLHCAQDGANPDLGVWVVTKPCLGPATCNTYGCPTGKLLPSDANTLTCATVQWAAKNIAAECTPSDTNNNAKCCTVTAECPSHATLPSCSCDAGFSGTPNWSTDKNMWTHTCSQIMCNAFAFATGYAPGATDGCVDGGSLAAGKTCSLQCGTGYQPEFATLSCSITGTLGAVTLACTEMQCGQLTMPEGTTGGTTSTPCTAGLRLTTKTTPECSIKCLDGWAGDATVYRCPLTSFNGDLPTGNAVCKRTCQLWTCPTNHVNNGASVLCTSSVCSNEQCCKVTPTETLTGTLTASHSQSATATYTQSSTDTVTASQSQSTTETYTRSVSGTVTVTATDSPTVTLPTITPSVTETTTPSLSASTSASSTLSPTESYTGTATDSLTHTDTRSLSDTASVSATVSRTLRSRTLSATATGTLPTVSRSLSETVTPTHSATLTASASLSHTDTASSTATASSSATASGTATASRTATFTETLTTTASLSASETSTATATRSLSASSSLTATASLSATHTATHTATGSRSTSTTLTASATASLSHSAELTLTTSVSLTDTRSASQTRTASATATLTSTATLSPSVSLTLTAATPTLSASGSASATATATQSATATRTHSATMSFTKLTATPTSSETLPTPTHSPSRTLVTPSPTISATRRTATGTPTVSLSSSTTATGSATFTSSATASETATGTLTLPTATASQSNSQTATASSTGSVTITRGWWELRGAAAGDDEAVEDWGIVLIVVGAVLFVLLVALAVWLLKCRNTESMNDGTPAKYNADEENAVEAAEQPHTVAFSGAAASPPAPVPVGTAAAAGVWKSAEPERPALNPLSYLQQPAPVPPPLPLQSAQTFSMPQYPTQTTGAGRGSVTSFLATPQPQPQPQPSPQVFPASAKAQPTSPPRPSFGGAAPFAQFETLK